MIKKLIIFLAIFLLFKISYALDVAITVDDLPENGQISLNSTRLEIASKILRILQKHHILGVYGFINASHATDENNLLLLQSWISHGNFIRTSIFCINDII